MIIQDLQNDVIMDGGAFAASGAPAHAKQQNVVENVRRLADAARARGVAVIHVWFIVGYFVPYNFFALKADTFPPMPSFLRAGICGQGTDYACPSGAVPIPHGRSLHVAPDDPRLPADVRAHQGLPGR